MATKLLVVESPAKAKTIKKYLGKDFTVLASYGHVRDLVPKTGAVDPEKHFAMLYQPIEKNAGHVDKIANALKKAKELYLATDPDREGEAISWHLCELLKERKVLKKQPVHRVAFYEVTKSAIKAAVEHPRDISEELVDAQQTRRALDYLVGFNLSPLLWKKVRPGLSAGRVQSPALRMIVEREIEIENFKAEEYWTIAASLNAKEQNFEARLIEYRGEKIEQFSIVNENDALAAKKELLKAADGKLIVSKIEKKQRQRNPAAPFITSTLQQEAARKLGFSAQKTMRIAQQLYEGVAIDEGEVGLITYMRTDSVNLAEEALSEIRQAIVERYGKEFLPEEIRYYKTKSKNAQEAHEAIRPTSCHRYPDTLKQYLNDDQIRLYTLIWQRTMACQMINALFDVVTIDFSCGAKNTFRASGSTLINPGFLTVYEEGRDDAKKEPDDETRLPALEENEAVDLLDIIPTQHFTEPPPRYSEASLVKALEEYGIGRPSTYAAIVGTLLDREYVTLESKRFKPTDVGRIVSKFLTDYFTKYVDYGFTANLEDELDAISRGEEKMLELLEKFWQPFKDTIEKIEATVKRKDVTQEALEDKCPLCGKPLVIRLGKKGRFIGCSGYPDCKYTANISAEEKTPEPVVEVGRDCPDCGKKLVFKVGRYGKFIGCSGYPECKHIEPLEKPTDTGVVCPVCKEANLLKRRSRRGTYFYSCARYPKCKYATWNQPINEKCPKCGWPILTIKETKRRGKEKVCPQKDCGFIEKL
jgi:DNA topoisomerase I